MFKSLGRFSFHIVRVFLCMEDGEGRGKGEGGEGEG